MKLIAQDNNKAVKFSVIEDPDEFSTPFNGNDFVCVIFNNKENIAQKDQNQISDLIVVAGCRYAVCAGHNCSTWDDSIDMAYICTDANFEPPDDTFVMTSWHEKDSVEDILFHAFNCTNFDQNIFNNYLVVLIGNDDQVEKEVLKEIKKFCK